MCLAEFAATYVTKYQPRDADNDVLPPNETDTESTQITLTNGYGKMNKCRKPAVIRFRTYNKDYDSTNWFRAKLMLYYPWLNETTNLLGGYSTYEEHYNHVKPIIVAYEQKYTLADIEGLEVDENNIPEHAWNQIAPNTESTQAQSRAVHKVWNTLLKCPKKTLMIIPISLHLQVMVVYIQGLKLQPTSKKFHPVNIEN